MKKYIKIGIFLGIGVWLYTSGTLQKAVDYFSNDDRPSAATASLSDTDSSEKSSLLDLIDVQSRLADDINAARRSGDRDEMKRLFTEFEELESRYQQNFSQASRDLSTAEGNDISRQHREVIRKLN